jgi:hypothetical protein
MSSRNQVHDRCAELLSRLSEIDQLFQTPVDGQIDKAEKLALSIARKAPTGGIADLAMHVMSATSHLKLDSEPEAARGGFDSALARLRSALEEQARTEAAAAKHSTESQRPR